MTHAPHLSAKLDQLRALLRDLESVVVAYSGGTDSSVLLDLVARYAPAPPVAVLFVSTGLEPEETRQHVAETVAGYGFRLHVVGPVRAYREQWGRTGFPMLGKASARAWTREHPGSGLKIDCSACCKALKLDPGRKATRALGATMPEIRRIFSIS